MKRRSLPELEDFSWLPAVVRDGATGYLEFLQRLLKPYDGAAAILNQCFLDSNAEAILDLCSGAGGPLASLAPRLRTASGLPPEITLSDRYPNRDAVGRSEDGSNGAFRYLPDSLDARFVPPEIRGLRTLFTALHHFEPDDAREILRRASAAGQPIAIFEITERTAGSILRVCALSFAIFFLTPFLRPRKLSRLVFTYLLPLIPFVVFWDGIASSLKSFTLAELRALPPEAGGSVWRHGSIHSVCGARVLYLTGTPLHPEAGRVAALS